MWEESVLRNVARASRAGASVATFSAAGALRRSLGAVGFDVSRRPGFGRKRESVCARLVRRPEREAPGETPWDLDAAALAAGERQALVLGAGLAGCHAAAALARRGWQVQVLEAGAIAGRASGNAQGLLFHRFSHQRSPLADFSLQAVAYAHQLYAAMFASGALRQGRDGDLTGCLQTPPPRGNFAALRTALADLPELASILSAQAASDHLGTTIREDCLWQAHSGWLAPASVCRALLQHPAIRVETGCGRLALERDVPATGSGAQWIARDGSGSCRGSAPVAIVAAGGLCRDLAVTAALPLRIARGQTTLLPANDALTLQTCLCHRGYIAPAVDGFHAIGATFTAGDGDTGLRPQDQQRNLDELARALPDWRGYLTSLDAARLGGRAELRCVSPDYLPLVGPVPDGAAFRQRYAVLGSDARRVVPEPGSYLPGLYVSTAHGSRGLSYAALGAELLAGRICGEAPPLPTELCRALAPARFLIRAIVRGEAI
jgi:tRNA 5-methylaminomethyl-2-thiouridine biosynthesis bifunctional protein